MNRMKSNLLFRFFCLIAAIFLVGTLMQPLLRATARKALDPLDNQIIVNPTSGLITTEAGATAVFTVVLDSEPASAVTITLSTSDPTEGIISQSSVTLNPGNWSIEQTVVITGTDDWLIDGDIAYQIIITPAVSNDPNYNGQDPPDVSVTNLDDDTAGITIDPLNGLLTTEAGGAALFTVALDSQPEITVTLGMTSSDPTEGLVSPSILSFNPQNWSLEQPVTVTGVDDLLLDGDIGYQILTGPAVSADPNYSGFNPPDVSLTNQDDEVAGIIIDPASGLQTTEAGGAAAFTVVLGSQPAMTVTIALSSSDLTEGSVSPDSLTFDPSNWSSAQTVTVTGVDDPAIDGDIAYQVVTAPAVSGDLDYSGLDAADLSVTNLDDDVAGITVAPVSGLLTSEAGGTDSFTVVLDSQPQVTVTVGLSSSDPTEGAVSPQSLSFTPDNWFVEQVVTVSGLDDLASDGNVLYQILTASAVSLDPNYSGLDAPDVSVTNQDNDAAGITVNPLSGLLTDEAGGLASFTVELNTQPEISVTIGLTSTDLTEGMVFPASLTFDPGNWSIAQEVTIAGVDDLAQDGNIAYQIITHPALSGDQNYNGLDAPDVSITNLDDDTAGIDVNPTSGLMTTEGGGAASFTVVLVTQPQATVTIGLSSSDPTEGAVSPAGLTFNSVNWSVAQSVEVTGVDDLATDGSVVYQIITSPALSADPNYNSLDAPDVSVTNQDDDAAGITVNPLAGLQTSEAGDTASFTVGLNRQPVADVTIGLSSSDTAEASVSPLQLTFTPSDWAVTRMITVTGVDDQLDDGDQPFSIVTAAASSSDPAYDGLEPPDVIGTNFDDDAAPLTEADAYLTNASPSQPLAIALPGVLANDSDENNDPLVAVKMTDPQKGVLDLDFDGSFVYTPSQVSTQLETDSFYYVASDGILSSAWTLVEIMIDPITPTIHWISPVAGGEVFYVSDQSVLLLVDAGDNLAIDRVRLFRWDAPTKRYVEIAIVDRPPYSWSLDSQSLNYGWNQVFAVAWDVAGNRSSLEFIWVYRNFPPALFLPWIGG